MSHCYLRDESHTFRTDRIIECVDNDTGEVVEDVSSYLVESYRNTPEYKCKVAKEQELEYYETFMKKYDVLFLKQQ